MCHERIKWGVFSLLEPRHLSQDLELELWMKMKLHFWLFAKSKFWYLLFSLALCKGRRKLWRGKVISRIPISGNVFAFQIYLGNCSYIYKWENKCIFIWNILSKMYLKNTLLGGGLRQNVILPGGFYCSFAWGIRKKYPFWDLKAFDPLYPPSEVFEKIPIFGSFYQTCWRRGFTILSWWKHEMAL